MLVKFDSIESFVKTADAKVPLANRDIGTKHFFGGDTFSSAVEKALYGDDRCVAEAERMIEGFTVSAPDTAMFKTVRSPFGGRVSVSDYLAGSPTLMRRRVKQVSDVAPVKMVVSLASSWTIPAKEMTRRGTAVLALLMQLQKVRPVELFLLLEVAGTDRNDGAGPAHYQLIRVESKPLNISVVAYAICHVGYI